MMNTVDGSEDLDLMPNDHVLVSSVSSLFFFAILNTIVMFTHPCAHMKQFHYNIIPSIVVGDIYS